MIEKKHVHKNEISISAADKFEGDNFLGAPEFKPSLLNKTSHIDNPIADSSILAFQMKTQEEPINGWVLPFQLNKPDKWAKSNLNNSINQGHSQAFSIENSPVDALPVQMNAENTTAAKTPGFEENISDYSANVSSKTPEKERLEGAGCYRLKPLYKNFFCYNSEMLPK